MQEDRPNEVPIIIEHPLFIFFDWGKVNDCTWRAIGYPVETEQGVGVHICELLQYSQGTPYDEILEHLDRFIDDVGAEKVVMVGWDNTGVGAGIEDFIKSVERKGVQVMPVVYSLEAKSRMYTMFKLLAERNVRGGFGVKMPYVAEADRQWSTLRFERSSRGYLQVHHENDADRDDAPDAIVGLCSLIVNPESPPVSLTIIEEENGDSDRQFFTDEELGSI